MSITRWPSWNMPRDNSGIIDAESCDGWTTSGVNSPTISVTLLAVPRKARKAYKDGCHSFKEKQFSRAALNLRKAVKTYPKYAAAWVTLGHVLATEHKTTEAHKACSHAVNADPDYAPGYVCLADVAASDREWNDVSALSSQALSLDPVTNMYAFFYAADADLHLQRLPQAERNARSAEKLDTWNHLPQVHLLLAHVYRAKGNADAEADELRQFLKHASKSEQSAAARKTLAELEGKSAH